MVRIIVITLLVLFIVLSCFMLCKVLKSRDDNPAVVDKEVSTLSEKQMKGRVPFLDTISEAELMTEFGRNLKDLLDEYQMSQNELAEATEMSKAAISCYVNGERMPSLKALVNIAYVLECDIEELVNCDQFVV